MNKSECMDCVHSREVTVSGCSTVLQHIFTNLQVVAGAADAIGACVVDEEVRTEFVVFVNLFC